MSADLRACARRILNARHRRNRFLPAALFGEIAWEILLTLYAFDEATHTAAFVAHRLQSPPSTSDRWIDYLISQDLVARQTQHKNQRLSAIALTKEGRRRLEDYLSGLPSEAFSEEL